MLTESEREWLEERVLLPCYSCKYCTGYHNQSCNAFEPLSSCWNRLCENFDFEYFDEEVFLDAADFSERVAVKLAINDTSYLPCHQKGHGNQCPYDNYCPTDRKKTAWCKLKHARLQVEEEMDANN